MATEQTVEFIARIAELSAQNNKMRAALKHVARLVEHADGSVGLVDNPHIKALRVASKRAKEVLAEVGE